MEEWKGVAFLTHVQVSNLGRYRVFVKGRWSDPQLGSLRPDGYLTGRFNSQQYRIHRLVSNRIRVHRAVWVAFNGEIPEGHTVDHINHVKDDNRLENLRLATAKEQRSNQVRTGAYASTVKRRVEGRPLGSHDWQQFKSQKHAAATLTAQHNTMFRNDMISRVCVRNRGTTNGWEFRFVPD